MKLVLLSVGKPRDAALTGLHDRYAARMVRLGVEYRCRQVPEVRSGGRYSDDEVRRREAAALTKAFEPRGNVVALDAKGKLLDSPGLASRLERWATPRATFVIGGPLGLHPELVGKATATWSLTPLTLPHELARVVVAEQLYRALTLLRGVPYHK